MGRYIINRDVDTERLERFSALNRHVSDVERFAAMEGHRLDREALIARGLMEHGLTYTAGALGAALSHLTLWSRAAEAIGPTTVFEDDVILCSNFDTESARLIAGLPDAWDVILWGYNFNAPVTLDLLPGYSQGVITFDQKRLQGSVHNFAAEARRATLFPLLQGFGLCAYTVSPIGARHLIQRCVPLRAQAYHQLGLERMVINVGIDVVTSFHFAGLNAFAAFAPLAVSPNEKAQSLTTQRR